MLNTREMLKTIARIGAGAGVISVALFAASDVWTKPYTEWTDLDVQKIMTDSPWADRMQVETGQRGPIGNADDKGGPIQGSLTAPVTVYWQSALPIKQAMFGRANATDAQKQLMAREEPVHILRVQGLPGSVRSAAQDVDKLKSISVIKIKGKADLHPSELQLSGAPTTPPGAAPGGGKGAPGGGFGGGFGTFDVFFVFPKDAPISVDDKEMEFQTKIGAMAIRKKFKLKDMVYNGKLEF
jgi:hypothetical protein